jgi:uncharacterized membrane protein YbaN (DUF454 family)
MPNPSIRGTAMTESRANRSRTVRWLLIASGAVFVGLGLIGAALPLLPTTPFMLLAAACFARSSERFHQALLRNRLIGPTIREWRATRSIPRRAKITAMMLIVLTFGTTIFFLTDAMWLRVLLIGVAGVGVWSFSRIPTRESLVPAMSEVKDGR